MRCISKTAFVVLGLWLAMLSVVMADRGQDATGNSHVLIVEGGISVESHNRRYYQQSKLAYEFYRESGLAPSQITLLAGPSGTVWRREDFDNRDMTRETDTLADLRPDYPPKSGGANLNEIRAKLLDIASTIEDGGTLEIFIHDHSFNNYSGPMPDGRLPENFYNELGVNLWGEELSAADFAKLLQETIGPRNINLRMTGAQCFSGALHSVVFELNKFRQRRGVAGTACAVSSTGVWQAANATGDRAATMAFFGARLERLRERQENSLYRAAADLADADKENFGRSQLSSMAYMHSILGVDDHNPGRSMFGKPDGLEKSARAVLRRSVRRNDTPVERGRASLSKEQKSGSEVPPFSLTQGQEGPVADILKASEILQGQQPLVPNVPIVRECQNATYALANTLNKGMLSLLAKASEILEQVSDSFQIPGLTESQQAQIQSDCRAMKRKVAQLDFEAVRRETDEILQAAESLDVRTRQEAFTEELRNQWLAVKDRADSLLRRPGAKELPALVSRFRYCTALHEFMKTANEAQKEQLGSLLKCELAPMR